MSHQQPDFSDVKVAILTSGGDAQGMNAAIRSCGRMVLSLGARMFVVKWGYQGLVEGGENIQEYQWNDLSKTIHIGGTILGTARCAYFLTPEGRMMACLNLIQIGINKLVVIGGDGSLTGADIFRKEWPDHIETLEKTGQDK
ncbi:ATP-dependent 6-phosphofructokinase, liver type [Thelohanellus kitauei]|uniref:6-phosphofructokinase n=1 Tax=Thelohanellus kitauei TaxID=669202 RepID=A0A0C2JXY8_THEKT|nr:ATP-dependent 6-phosphofructokinase, liver type [Thelohanellus kitauei]